MNISYLELDEIYWETNWLKKSNVINTYIEPFIRQEAWIVDGYYNDSTELLYENANIIFLLVYLMQL